MEKKKDKLIYAKDTTCMKEGCKNKGYRWITVDIDIAPLCYCEKHLREFEMNILGILKNEQKT